MEQATATLDPAAEAESSSSAASEASASPAPDTTPTENAQMNALLRGGLSLDVPGSASKSDTDDDDGEVDAQDGASAPTGDVKPSGQTGRRGAAAEIARLKAENERLQRAYDEANPPPPDASEETRKAALETESRFRRLLVKPESDPDWTHEDVAFLEGEKQRRALVPELQQHYETVLADDLEKQTVRVNEWAGRIRAKMLEDYGSAKDLPGVDEAAIRAAPTFADRDRIVYAAGRAQADAEISRLRDELADAKRDLFGAVRTPMNGGRSSPGRTYSENDYMNTLLRGGRA